MKKLLLIAFLALTFMAHAQTITIGEDQTISNQVPIYTLYNYSLTEQIFRADEIEYAGYLNTLRFRIGYSYNSSYTCDIEVYLKHVTKSSFADPADYEPVTPDDLVYSGPWNLPAYLNDWMSITFDTPFAYNGTDNLLIAIRAKADNFAIRYFKYSGASNTVFSCYSDSHNPDPSDLSTFTGIQEVISQRPNIKLVFGGSVELAEDSPNTLSVYPNPANGLLHIDGADHETVRVYDATGRLVMQETCHGTLDISHLQNGLYAVATNTRLVKILKK